MTFNALFKGNMKKKKKKFRTDFRIKWSQIDLPTFYQTMPKILLPYVLMPSNFCFFIIAKIVIKQIKY